MTDEKLTPLTAVQEYIANYFEDCGIENGANLSRYIISEVLGMSYAKALLKKPMLKLWECDKIDDACNRVAQGEPVQYVFGIAPFRYLELEVTPDVLIPRPETEMMVDIVAYYLKKNNIEWPLLADIGTGSGALAVSFATEFEESIIYATDVSKKALVVAMRNAKRYDQLENIYFEQCSCLDNFEYFQHSRNHFNAIVSNPPYVPTEVCKKLPREVRDHEPMLALDGGEDGLDVYREILKSTRGMLEPGGLYLFELHEACLDLAKKIALDEGLTNVSIIKDLAGKDRFLAAID